MMDYDETLLWLSEAGDFVMSVCKHKYDLLQCAILGAVLSLIHEMVYVFYNICWISKNKKLVAMVLCTLNLNVIIHN